MSITLCEHGHYYDNRKYESCPYCGRNRRNETVEEETQRLDPRSMEAGQDTVSVWRNEGPTPYVTGWLVCVEGSAKGRDYRLHSGVNRIGRSPVMDVCIENDPQVTRDNHCSVIYDHKSNSFFLMPSVGTLIYKNGRMVMENVPFSSGEQVQVGGNLLELVAFCAGDKKWDE